MRERTITGFALLLLEALLMAGNHVAARLAFDHGASVATAVLLRSSGTALVVFNTFPLMTTFWARVFYRQHSPRAVLLVMPIILLGLVLALDVQGSASGLGAARQWQRMGAGVAFALAAAAMFSLALVLTEHEAHGVDGRVRTLISMVVVALVAAVAALARGSLALPDAAIGWWGLALLTLLYGSGITLLFTVLPRPGVVGNSAVLNVEPVFALVIGWLVLHQTVGMVQMLGALLVVAAVMWLGMRRR